MKHTRLHKNTWSRIFARSIGATTVFDTPAATPPIAKSVENFFALNLF